MKLAPIIEALRTNCPSFERRIFGLYAWSTVDDDVFPAMPCAYVLPSRVEAGTAFISTQYRQKISNHFSVVLCVPLSKEDALGRSGHDLLEDLKEEVFRAILGASLEYPEKKHLIVSFDGQQWHQEATNRARLAEVLGFSYNEELTGNKYALGRILESLPELNGVRLKAGGFPVKGENELVTAELLKQ